MPATTVGRGNILYDWLVFPATVTWSSTALSSTTSELTATVPGLQVGDYVDMFLTDRAMPTGLTFSNIRVSAANTLAATWIAATASLTIPTGQWILNVCRPEGGTASLPVSAA